MNDNERQVVIYLDDPKGQLIQTTLYDYRNFWRKLGWQVQGRPPELPGMVTVASGDQRNLF